MSKGKFHLLDYYTSPYSCLFSNRQGKLFRVNCPFKVVCIATNSYHKAGAILRVTRVFAAKDRKILYEIDRNVLAHTHYGLLL